MRPERRCPSTRSAHVGAWVKGRPIMSWLTACVGCLGLSGCGSSHVAANSYRDDPPLLVPWSRVGDIALGGRRSDIEQEYGSVGNGFRVVQRYGDATEGYYRIHGDDLAVTFYGDRVGRIGFSTPYYRTKSGFGVGSAIPLGPCRRTATNPCEHRWHGFIYNPSLGGGCGGTHLREAIRLLQTRGQELPPQRRQAERSTRGRWLE